ncbi:hypothetical protein DFJ43DRAFT_561634 [Lentinula guzmanii]|uniref:Phosphatidate cytidylyltransferase n=1 Tax=Lentinula guzmanii TaxID=2804957 RepID=A0AA38J719_9AGAR|nr:hypothetical protein DFJ43DRAFT_561634 [Lentinula guzmanii]
MDPSMSTTSHDRRRSIRRTKPPVITSFTNSTTVPNSSILTKRNSPSYKSSSLELNPAVKGASTKAKSSLSVDKSDLQAPQLHDLVRKVIQALEGLTGAHWDMEVLGLETSAEEENDNKKERGDQEPEKRNSAKGSESEDEMEAAKELLLNGNGVAHVTEGKKKVDWEIPRKLLHSSIGFFTIYLYLSRGNAKVVVYTLWSALCVIAPADYLRFKYPSFSRIYERHLGFLMRESEKTTTNGVIWYIIGVNFALTFYPLDVATVAILILSWADTAASTVGRLWAGHWGLYTPRLPSRLPIVPFLPAYLRHRLALPLAPRKSLAGFIAASFTGACIAFVFWGWIAPIPLRVERGDVTWFWDEGVFGSGVFGGWLSLGLVTIFAGLVSGIAEALDLGSLDDNLTLPIISGGCLWAFFKVLGVVSRSWISA